MCACASVSTLVCVAPPPSTSHSSSRTTQHVLWRRPCREKGSLFSASPCCDVQALGVVCPSKQMWEPWRSPTAGWCREPDFGVRVFCFLSDLMAIYSRGPLAPWPGKRMRCSCWGRLLDVYILRNIPHRCGDGSGFQVLF